jgi:hypothetical protein
MNWFTHIKDTLIGIISFWSVIVSTTWEIIIIKRLVFYINIDIYKLAFVDIYA